MQVLISFFFNDTATTEIYTLSLHDALPISSSVRQDTAMVRTWEVAGTAHADQYGLDQYNAANARDKAINNGEATRCDRSEEHTSELQSRQYLVCRLLLEKKKNNKPKRSSRR